MTDKDDGLKIEDVARSLGITIEEYKLKVRTEQTERIGINSEALAKRLELIQMVTDYNNKQPLKGFTDYSDVGEEDLHPDKLSF